MEMQGVFQYKIYHLMEKLTPAVLAQTRKSRFRTSHAFRPNINQYVASEVMCRLGLARRDEAFSNKDNVYLDLGKKQLDRLEKHIMQHGFSIRDPPMLCCANDNEVQLTRSARLFDRCLTLLLPFKAPWEQ